MYRSCISSCTEMVACPLIVSIYLYISGNPEGRENVKEEPMLLILNQPELLPLVWVCAILVVGTWDTNALPSLWFGLFFKWANLVYDYPFMVHTNIHFVWFLTFRFSRAVLKDNFFHYWFFWPGTMKGPIFLTVALTRQLQQSINTIWSLAFMHIC